MKDNKPYFPETPTAIENIYIENKRGTMGAIIFAQFWQGYKINSRLIVIQFVEHY